MINVCDFSGMLERINQEGRGKPGVNSEGACAGLAWRKARLSLGGPPHPHTSEDEEGTRSPTCCSAAGTPRQGHAVSLARVLPRGIAMPSHKGKLSTWERSGWCPGAPSRNAGIIFEDEGSKRFMCLEKERSRGGKEDFITEFAGEAL